MFKGNMIKSFDKPSVSSAKATIDESEADPDIISKQNDEEE